MSDVREAIVANSKPKASAPAPIYYTTGLDILDLCVGGGMGYGFPGGYIINFVGDKSAGKTLLAIEMLVANKKRHKKYRPNHDDSESGCTFDTMKLYGVDLYGDTEPRKSTTVEEMDANVGLWLDELGKDGKGIYVVDSLDGLSDNEREERSEVRKKLQDKGEHVENKGTYGMSTPKFLSQDFFKTKTVQVSNHEALLIIVSQVRENMEYGMFKPKYTRAGGKALDFYAHTCLWLTTVHKITKTVDGENKVVGVVVEAETKKSKTPRPFRKCRFSLYFDYGLDNIGSNIDYLFSLRGPDGKLTAEAQTIPWKGKKATFNEMLAWLKTKELYDAAKAAKKAETGNTAIGAEWLSTYIRTTPEVKAAFEEEFGVTMGREALIAECEANPKMAQELTDRVRAKWEAGEESISSNRKSKYA